MNDTSPPKRSIGRILIAVLFALLALNALMEAVESDIPPPLRALQ